MRLSVRALCHCAFVVMLLVLSCLSGSTEGSSHRLHSRLFAASSSRASSTLEAALQGNELDLAKAPDTTKPDDKGSAAEDRDVDSTDPAPVLTRLALINCVTMKVVADCTNKAVDLDLTSSSLRNAKISLRAYTRGPKGRSVIFSLGGKQLARENFSPYVVNGDTNGKANPWFRHLKSGNYKIEVQTVTGNKNGDKGFCEVRLKNDPAKVAEADCLCTSWGDTHIITADGFKYDNQNVGEFVLLRRADDGLEVRAIQVRQTNKASSVAYNKALLFALGADRVIAHLKDPLDTKGKIELLCSTEGKDFVALTAGGKCGQLSTATKDGSITVDLLKGFSARFTTSVWTAWMHIQVYITIPHGPATSGICGTCNRNVQDDCRAADLAAGKNPPAISASSCASAVVTWRSTTTAFVPGTVPTQTQTQTQTPGQTTTTPSAPRPPTSASRSAPIEIPVVTNTAPEPVVDINKVATKQQITEATTVCNAQGVPSENLKDCILEVVVGGPAAVKDAVAVETEVAKVHEFVLNPPPVEDPVVVTSAPRPTTSRATVTLSEVDCVNSPNAVRGEPGDFTSCSALCGPGQRSRVVPIFVNDVQCANLTEIEGCNNGPCAVNCIMSNFSDWGQCSKPCGGGTQNSTRTVLVPAEHNGTACPPEATNIRFQPCNTQECDQDCTVGEWSSWSTCTAACGGGTHNRTRLEVLPKKGNGKDCPPLSEHEACNTEPCSVDCVLSGWSEWSPCIKGEKYRHRNITVAPQHNGKPCDALVENATCTEVVQQQQPPPPPPPAAPNVTQLVPVVPKVDCNVSEWTLVGTCTHGKQNHTRHVLTDAQGGGKACPPLEEQVDCKADCILSAWSDWSACVKGERHRNRTILEKEYHGGHCNATEEKEKCSTPCVMGPWSNWTVCKDGVQTRKRDEVTPAYNMECHENKTETQHCEVPVQQHTPPPPPPPPPPPQQQTPPPPPVQQTSNGGPGHAGGTGTAGGTGSSPTQQQTPAPERPPQQQLPPSTPIQQDKPPTTTQTTGSPTSECECELHKSPCEESTTCHPCIQVCQSNSNKPANPLYDEVTVAVRPKTTLVIDEDPNYNADTDPMCDETCKRLAAIARARIASRIAKGRF